MRKDQDHLQGLIQGLNLGWLVQGSLNWLLIPVSSMIDGEEMMLHFRAYFA